MDALRSLDRQMDVAVAVSSLTATTRRGCLSTLAGGWALPLGCWGPGCVLLVAQLAGCRGLS